MRYGYDAYWLNQRNQAHYQVGVYDERGKNITVQYIDLAFLNGY